jgi:hypothetical protein
MAWVTLSVMLICFVGVLIALIFAAFSPAAGPWMRGAFATIDSLLGISIHQIVRNLFPAGGSGTKKAKPAGESGRA